MKKSLFPTTEPEEPVTLARDVDADDPEASDLLDAISRDTSEEEQPEEPTKAVTRPAASGGPFIGATYIYVMPPTPPMAIRRRLYYPRQTAIHCTGAHCEAALHRLPFRRRPCAHTQIIT